jgi:branched-chain amino acid transport system permease protein
MKIIAGILAVIGLILLPHFTNPYNIHLMIITGINAILAMTFILMLRTGLVSIAIAAFWGVGAYASAMLVMKGGFSVWAAMPLAAIITGLIAFVLGIFLVKNAGFSFVILTMALGELAVLLFGNTPFIGGYNGLTNIPPPEPISLFGVTIEFADKLPNYYLMLVLFAIVALAFRALYVCWAGRAWQAIGLNIRLAESLGINLYRYRIAVFTVASAAAGLTGAFYAHYFQAIQPGSFESFKTIYIHIMAILGGIGCPVLGPIVGAAILTFVPETLRLASELEPIITGVIIILLILFLPDGIMSLFAGKKKSGGVKDRLVRIQGLVNKLLNRSKA